MGKNDKKSGDKSSAAKGKGGEKESAGKSKGAQSINVRHILVRAFPCYFTYGQCKLKIV